MEVPQSTGVIKDEDKNRFSRFKGPRSSILMVVLRFLRAPNICITIVDALERKLSTFLVFLEASFLIVVQSSFSLMGRRSHRKLLQVNIITL